MKCWFFIFRAYAFALKFPEAILLAKQIPAGLLQVSFAKNVDHKYFSLKRVSPNFNHFLQMGRYKTFKSQKNIVQTNYSLITPKNRAFVQLTLKKR